MAPLNRTRTRVLERSADGAEVTLSEAPGGLRLITERMPWSRSASIGVWVGVGSIDEQPQLAGASHFLEHLLFKGTATRSARDIAVAIDGVGGDFNAFTSHEYTCYFVHVLADAAELAVDLVGDVVLDATIPTEDVDVERQVILEEFAMREDNPEDALVDAFSAAVFDGLPIARPVIGNLETIESLSRAQITGYYRRRYRPPSMVVAVAGGIEHADVWRWVRRAFARRLDHEQQPEPIRGAGRGRSSRSGFALVERDTEQAHLNLGVRALSRHDPRRHALAVLSTVLGGGMSSRLFRAIREDRGLAYSVYSSVSAYAGTGSFSVYLGCQPENLDDAVRVLADELTAVRSGIAGDELDLAKRQLIGSTLLGLEDSESRMSRIGKNLLTRGEFRPVPADTTAIDAVTAADVAAVADDLLGSALTAGLVGPYASAADTPDVLRQMVENGIGR